MNKLVNHVKDKLAAGTPVLGTAITMPSPQLVRSLVDCGFDWLMIDFEHGPIGPESAQAMINATQGSNCVPMARLPSTENWMAKLSLDLGALGLFFPLVMNAGEADRAIKSALYPPKGTRGFAPIHAGYRWHRSMTEYAVDADDAILKIIMIEHVDAIDNLEDILKIPGIDMIFIAPYDMSQSLDLAGQFDHPLVKETVKRAEQIVQAAGLPLGGYAGSVEGGQALLDRGYQLVMLGYDGMLVETAVAPLVDSLKR